MTSALKKSYEEESFAEKIRIYKVPVRNRNIHHSSNRELAEYFFRGLAARVRIAQAKKSVRFLFCLERGTGRRGCAGAQAHHRTSLYPACLRARYSRFRAALPNDSLLPRAFDPSNLACGGQVDRKIRTRNRNDSRGGPSHRLFADPKRSRPKQIQSEHLVPDDGPLKLLCVGRLIERKGQHHLIEAVKRLTDEGIDISLDLVGTGDARPANEAQVSRLGLADRVRFSATSARRDRSALRRRSRFCAALLQ